MDKVDNDNLNSDFAKACQAAGRYEDAAKAYERAKDMDKVNCFSNLFQNAIEFELIFMLTIR